MTTRRLRRLAICSIAAGAAFALSALVPAHAQQPVGNRFEGTLSVIWGDPRPGAGGGAAPRFSITTTDGAKHKLALTPAQQNTAIQSFGKRVVVQGSLSRNALGATSIAAEQIEPAAPAPLVREAAATTRKVLYILLKFSGDDQEPHPPSFFDALTNPQKPPRSSNALTSINGFYNATSWGKLQWQGDVLGAEGLNTSTHWLTLPKTKSGYAPCGWSGDCADLDSIEADGMQLAVNAGVDVSAYDNINFVLNNDLDCCAWGGGFTYNHKSYGATWEPPWGQEAGTYVHEFGHSIGLPHSGWVYYDYDSPWDEMSNGSPAKYAQCASYISDNDGGSNDAVYCTEPGAGYIVAHKSFLGWIPPANMVTIDSVGTQTIKLEDNATPLSGIKMVQICLAGQSCTGSNAHYLSVEARATTNAFQGGVPGFGVIIHDVLMNRAPIGDGNPCFFNDQSGWAVPIDATPGDYNEVKCAGNPHRALFNAEFVPGDTYKDRRLGVSVMVLRQSGSAFIIRVKRTK